MRAPGVRVRTRLVSRFGPGGVVEREEITPGLEQPEISLRLSHVLERARQVPREIAGGRVHAGRRVDAAIEDGDLLEYRGSLIRSRYVVEHREHIHAVSYTHLTLPTSD